MVGNRRGENAIYFNDGKGGLHAVRIGPVADTYGVAVVDLDGDGYPEIVTANSDAPNRIYANRPRKK